MKDFFKEFTKSLRDVFQIITSDNDSLISLEGREFLSKDTQEKEAFLKNMSEASRLVKDNNTTSSKNEFQYTYMIKK